ncbi:hypothetical protein BKA70DRAFT_1281057 [Coprinopsis sp. MPI-PUGE-AT-0042]|nr:hypothetical protein BKA70DRAFT_1281057 [Coprinopsis sp. MPI-PUGE-AT-0042]
MIPFPTIPIDDILHTILEHCRISDISSFTATSTHVRAIALPHLLHTVTLTTSGVQVSKFLTFILKEGDANRRDVQLKRYIINLKIGNRYAGGFETERGIVSAGVARAWMPMLTRALTLMPNLRRFSLGCSTEQVIPHSPDFPLALLGCSGLTFLSLNSVQRNASALLGRTAMTMSTEIFPSLKALSISCSFGEEEGIRSFLSLTCHQITSLRLSCRELGAYLTQRDGTPKLRFPLVTTLDLSNCTVSLKNLVAAFPNVQNLHLAYISDFGPPVPQEAVFPKLVSLDGNYGDMEVVLMSNPAGGNLRHLYLDDNSWSGGEQGVVFAPLQGAPHLKTLCFFIYDNETLSWWETLARMTPELSFLYGIFIQDLLKDIRITEEAPEAFANVPLETVLLELQFDEVGGISDMVKEEGIALSWARSVSTLKVIGVLLDGDPTKLEGKSQPVWLEVIRAKPDEDDLAGPSVRRLSAEREKSLTRSALDLWSCSRFGEL